MTVVPPSGAMTHASPSPRSTVQPSKVHTRHGSKKRGESNQQSIEALNEKRMAFCQSV